MHSWLEFWREKGHGIYNKAHKSITKENYWAPSWVGPPNVKRAPRFLFFLTCMCSKAPEFWLPIKAFIIWPEYLLAKLLLVSATYTY
jgi:hypothetical protein